MTTISIDLRNAHELTRPQIAYVHKMLLRWGITKAYEVDYYPQYGNLFVNGPESSLFKLGAVVITEDGYRLHNHRQIDGFDCVMNMDHEEAQERDEKIKRDAPAYRLRPRK